MESNKRPLMKHFASVLRKRALTTTEINEEISTQVLPYFSRKDLIQIIKEKYDGAIPKQHDLMELENADLLNIIGDDMYLIAYTTQKWSRAVESSEVSKKETPVKEPVQKKVTPQKATTNGKKGK